jgi:hypothetical protein
VSTGCRNEWYEAGDAVVSNRFEVDAEVINGLRYEVGVVVGESRWNRGVFSPAVMMVGEGRRGLPLPLKPAYLQVSKRSDACETASGYTHTESGSFSFLPSFSDQ